jgi:hypothetical protein
LRSFVNVWVKTLHKFIWIMSSPTCQESWGENELQKWTWNVILTKTLQMTRDFSEFFLLLCSASSWEPNFCINMYIFINTNLIYVDLLFKRLYCSWVSLYVILHELTEGSSKCFKFHYLVSQSILLDTYFLFLPKIFFVSICGVLIFLYQTVDLH